MPTSYGSKSSGYYNLQSYVDELATNGPYTVAVDAGQDCWWYYSGGIITADMGCPQGLNHAVTVVAYTPASGGTETNEVEICTRQCIDPLGKGKNKYCPSSHPDESYNRRGRVNGCCGDVCRTETETTVTDGTPAYWTIENSWGVGWGANGFMDIEITGGLGVVGINREMQYVRV